MKNPIILTDCPHCRTDVLWQDWLTKDEISER